MFELCSRDSGLAPEALESPLREATGTLFFTSILQTPDLSISVNREQKLPVGEDSTHSAPTYDHWLSRFRIFFDTFLGDEALIQMLIKRIDEERNYWNRFIITDSNVVTARQLVRHYGPVNCLVCYMRKETSPNIHLPSKIPNVHLYLAATPDGQIDLLNKALEPDYAQLPHDVEPA